MHGVFQGLAGLPRPREPLKAALPALKIVLFPESAKDCESFHGFFCYSFFFFTFFLKVVLWTHRLLFVKSETYFPNSFPQTFLVFFLFFYGELQNV